jgi:cell division protein FtsW (lipid II flippase)
MVAMWAIALGIVVVQRDLGAALLFFGVFLALLYAATGRLSLVIIGLILFLLGSALMANLFGHIRTRIDIWIDPFADPLGAGYQVVQALHAFARGGLSMGLGADFRRSAAGRRSRRSTRTSRWRHWARSSASSVSWPSSACSW